MSMTRILRGNEVGATTNDADDDGDERGEQRYAVVKGRRRLLMLDDITFIAELHLVSRYGGSSRKKFLWTRKSWRMPAVLSSTGAVIGGDCGDLASTT